MHRIRGALLALLALTLLPAGPLAAQRAWDVSVVGGAGYIFPIRTLGQSAAETEELQNLQPLADLDKGMTAHVGVEIGRPGSDVSFRGRVHTTIGGHISMIAGICNLFPDSQNPICTPFGIDVTMMQFLADIRFKRGNPGDVIRPIMSVGAGIRSWSFGTLPACDLTTDPNWTQTVCPNALDLYENVSSSPAIIFGVGLMGEVGPLQFTLEGEPHLSAFSGGSNRAEGNTMIDMNVALSAKLTIF